MDKIPAALQHKIDYIKALDIPAEQKASRIAIAIIDYHNRDVSMAKWYLNDIASLIAGANIDDAESQVKRVNTHILTLNGLLEMGVNKEVLGSKQKYMLTGKAVKEIMDDVINDDKGLSPASSGTPMPQVKAAKTSVNGGKWGALPSKNGGKGSSELEPKRVICEDAKLMERSPVDYNAVYLTCCVAAAFVLSGAVGLMLGVTFGSSL